MTTLPWGLLRRVSRSFALSLQILPGPVREPIALAYLLARLSDTEADGASNAAEAELLECRAEVAGLLERSPDRAAIGCVLATIREGQRFDVERFGAPGAPALDAAELERYTYLVAGSVGEFWTDLCLAKLGDCARLPATELRGLGRRFGQGLQLVNILRDRHEDAARGRVYVPPGRFGSCLAEARSHLDAAALYCRALRNRRLRAACNLPRLLGIGTLDLVERAPAAPRAKVPRARVWILLARAFVA